MGRTKGDQGQLFYEFHLSDAVPDESSAVVRLIQLGQSIPIPSLRDMTKPHFAFRFWRELSKISNPVLRRSFSWISRICARARRATV